MELAIKLSVAKTEGELWAIRNRPGETPEEAILWKGWKKEHRGPATQVVKNNNRREIMKISMELFTIKLYMKMKVPESKCGPANEKSPLMDSYAI